jgi:hypothetical protein
MLTVSGIPVLSLSLAMPILGPWHANIELSTETAPESPIVITDGTNSFSGTLVPNRSGFRGNAFLARVIGGAGGLGTILDVAHYNEAKVRLMLADILSGAGETGSEVSDGPTLESELIAWSRARATAGTALTMLAEKVGAGWRVLDDGSVWFGPETFPEPQEALAFEALDPDPIDAARVIAGEALSLRPGMMFNGERVLRVLHTSGESVRTQYWVG